MESFHLRKKSKPSGTVGNSSVPNDDPANIPGMGDMMETMAVFVLILRSMVTLYQLHQNRLWMSVQLLIE